jgi:acetoacetate decarboxylase
MSTLADKKPDFYRMPTFFGPAVGPRQAPPGKIFDQSQSPKRFCVYVSYRTEAALLQKMLPPGFELRDEPIITFEFSYLKEIDWLAGRGYNMLTVRFPVRYQYQGSGIDGYFQPVVWENLTDPILSGREELGWNKIFADLPEAIQHEGGVTCHAEWMGFRFLELTITHRAIAASPTINTNPVLHQKYIPSTQAWGEADVNYVTMTPAGGSQARLLEATTGTATLSLHQPTWEEMPTQHACVTALAQLPIQEYIAAGTYSMIGGKDLSDQVRFI